MGTNPHIQNVYDLYWQAFDRIRKIPEIKTLQENEKFCLLLMESLDLHQVAIPNLVKGVHECEHMYPTMVAIQSFDRFLDATIRSRISRRVITEHHLVLSGKKKSIFDEFSSADIFFKCIQLIKDHTIRVRLIKQPQDFPKIIIDGESTTFTYLSEHIEYIIYQLLSNAVRHTILNNKNIIKITITSNKTDIVFRISDQGNGISKKQFGNVWSFSNHNRIGEVKHLEGKLVEQEMNPQIQLGIGLPMTKVYTEYWGGEVNLITMEGFGTDVYVKIPRLGVKNENLDNNNSPLDGAIL